MVINTAVGLTQVDPEMLDLGRVFNAPKWKVFAKIRIPNAYPYILSALKVTATAAVVGAIVGEGPGGVHEGLGLVGVQVVADDVVAGLLEVDGHRAAHDAESDEGDGADGGGGRIARSAGAIRAGCRTCRWSGERASQSSTQ